MKKFFNMKRLFNVKKLMMLMMLAVVMLTLTVSGTVLAAPTAELTALADYVPANVTVFAAIRTDHAFFEEIDALAAHIGSKTGNPVEPDDGIIGGLNDATIFSSDGELDYETGVRSWLGENAAIVFPHAAALFRGSGEPLILVSVTDRAAAQTFLDAILADDLESQNVVVEEADGATLYIASSNGDESYGLTDGLMVIFPSAYQDLGRQIVTTTPNEPLSGSADFGAALAALPGDDYSAFGYLNLRGVFTSLPEFMPTSSLPIAVDFAVLADAMGVQSFGATVLDSRVMAFDMAFVHGEVSVFEAFGLPAPTVGVRDAVDPGFARHFPANVFLYSHATNAGSQIGEMVDNIVTIGDPFMHDIISPLIRMAGETEAADFVDGFSFNTFTTFAELSIEGSIGLPSDQLYALLDGQYAGAFSVIPDPDTYVTFESLQVFENVDAEGSGQLIEGLARLLGDFRADFTFDDGVITVPTSKPLAAIMFNINPERQMNTTGADMLITASDALIVAGSRPQVEFALGSNAGNLAETDVFVYDSQFFLPGAQMLSFINIPALYPVFTDDAPLAEVAPQTDRDQINTVLSLFDSASVTRVSTEANTQFRFTLTMAK